MAARLVLPLCLAYHLLTLVDGVLPAGRYQTRWEAQGVAAGVYLYRTQADERVETKRVMVLR